MRTDSCSSDDEITFCVFSEELQEMFLVDYSESMAFSELDSYWSREIEIFE